MYVCMQNHDGWGALGTGKVSQKKLMQVCIYVCMCVCMQGLTGELVHVCMYSMYVCMQGLAGEAHAGMFVYKFVCL
jgi:hypothetical protein